VGQGGLVADDIPLPATSLVADDTDQDIISAALSKPGGNQEKFKKQPWIEFDCQKGVHHGKWSTYQDGKRVRVEGGYIGRFDKVRKLGNYATRRVTEFITINHNCHYPERFQEDLEECGISGIAVESWPSGRGAGRLSGSKRPSGSEGNDLHIT